MPSRKKAQGRARRAEKAKQAAEIKRDTCRHSKSNTRWNNNDWADEFLTEVDALIDYVCSGEYDGYSYYNQLARVANDMYTKHCQPFCERKIEIIREFMVSNGTRICVVESKKNDLTEASGIEMALPFAFMVQTIEVRNKHDGAFNEHIRLEIEVPLAGVISCPREIVKFFHRRNSCDCLQEIYYKLKETTKRVLVCGNCNEAKDKKDTFVCSSCHLAIYCSQTCAAAAWPSHKEECRYWTGVRESRKSAK